MNGKYDAVFGKDALGRKLPDSTQCAVTEKERYVGMFYFLHTTANDKSKLYNVTEILKKVPGAPWHPEWEVWGGAECHFWGEPLYGYYFNSDEWVVRKHVELLTLAGVDFIFFDTTNSSYFDANSKMILRVLEEYAAQGWDVPKIVYYTNTDSGIRMQEIYDGIYKPGIAKDLWFRLDGKPVIVGVEEEASAEVRAFFDIKKSQWPNSPIEEEGWPWMSFTRPQYVHKDDNGDPEVINVSVAQHPQVHMGDSAMYGEKENWGRAYNHGRNDTDTDPDAWMKGGNVAEQWEVAREADPRIVLFTGWNEWNAGKWDFRGPYQRRPFCMIDCANDEFSRDIEMMRGGYMDNYYMQFIGDVRRYKGAPEFPRFKDRLTIDIDGGFDQWDKVEAEYHGFTCENLDRDHPGFGRARYINTSGRNDFASCKIANDDKNIYFLVTTRDDITSFDGIGDWMKLYIRTQKDSEGYDYILNHTPIDDGLTTLAAAGGEIDGPIIARDIKYKVSGKNMMLALPRRHIMQSEYLAFQFKWADSKISYRSFEDFYENGDCMPIGRLSYGYSAGDMPWILPY